MILSVMAMLLFAGVLAIGCGLPLVVTALFWVVPRWRRYRWAASWGWCGSVIGLVACAALIAVPMLLLGVEPGTGGQGGVLRAPLMVLGGFPAAVVGLPAMSFLGYVAGFFRHLRRRQRATDAVATP